MGVVLVVEVDLVEGDQLVLLEDGLMMSPATAPTRSRLILQSP